MTTGKIDVFRRLNHRHTAGPWQYKPAHGAPLSFGRFYQVTSNFGLVADVCGPASQTEQIGFAQEVARANARLIEQAPKMLETLERLLRAEQWSCTEDRMTSKEIIDLLEDTIIVARGH